LTTWAKCFRVPIRKIDDSLSGREKIIKRSLFARTGGILNGSSKRCQLFQGNYISIDLKRQQTSSHTGIFLIDTKTGTVKRYLNKIDEQGRYIETWLPTDLQPEK
jgi:hypothetical protein